MKYFQKSIFQTSALLCLLCIATACGSGNSKLAENYTNEELGWSIDIPNGWTIISEERYEKIRQKGKDIIEESTGEVIDSTILAPILGFEKDLSNSLLVSAGKAELSYEGELEEDNAFAKANTYKIYRDQGLEVDSTSTSWVEIDGVKVQLFAFIVNHPNFSNEVVEQIYSGWYNGHVFRMYLTFDNEADREILEAALFNSKFEKSNQPYVDH